MASGVKPSRTVAQINFGVFSAKSVRVGKFHKLNLLIEKRGTLVQTQIVIGNWLGNVSIEVMPRPPRLDAPGTLVYRQAIRYKPKQF